MNSILHSQLDIDLLFKFIMVSKFQKFDVISNYDNNVFSSLHRHLIINFAFSDFSRLFKLYNMFTYQNNIVPYKFYIVQWNYCGSKLSNLQILASQYDL